MLRWRIACLGGVGPTLQLLNLLFDSISGLLIEYLVYLVLGLELLLVLLFYGAGVKPPLRLFRFLFVFRRELFQRGVCLCVLQGYLLQ